MNPVSPGSRRSFVRQLTLASTALAAATGRRSWAGDAGGRRLHLATNAYSWQVFFQREGRDFGASLDEGLAEVKASGIDGFEPGVGNPEEVRRLVPRLQKHGLAMRSVYVNSTLHTEADAEKSIANIRAIALEAKTAGTRIFVTNPNPLQWGGPQNKDDAQLRTQAAAMNRLGRELKALGLVLAYHNHDIELRNAAREFHHMMVGTDPGLVTLCLDCHWVYRGSGNSVVALMDVVKLYGPRVSELHLRQSTGGVWSETLAAGDIDYESVAAGLAQADARPHLVLEVAVEKGTPKTLGTQEAHAKSADYARRVFAAQGA